MWVMSFVIENESSGESIPMLALEYSRRSRRSTASLVLITTFFAFWYNSDSVPFPPPPSPAAASISTVAFLLFSTPEGLYSFWLVPSLIRFYRYTLKFIIFSLFPLVNFIILQILSLAAIPITKTRIYIRERNKYIRIQT